MSPTPHDYALSFDSRVAAVLPEAARSVEALGARLAAAGLVPEDLVDVASLDRLPVLTKDTLIEEQARRPPFGGLLARGAHVRRVFQSPGPLYEPEGGGPDAWRWRPALEAAGFAAGDRVLNAFSYHLSPAGAMFEEAALALGCTVVPGGVGSLELQARACLDLHVTAYIGLPSYLKALLEKLEEMSAGHHELRRAFVTAEPLPPPLRAWLEERVPTVRQGYGTAEAGNLGFECERAAGWHVPANALVQVCDLSTGVALWDGREGQVVATVFSPDYPLVRLGTGDLSAYHTEPCGCGIATPRLRGWLGRVGEAVKVRGMFLHPRQVRTLMAGVPQVAGFRFVVGRVEDRDVLRCEVVPEAGTEAEPLAQRVQERIRSGLRFNAEVRAVPSLEPDGPVLVDERDWRS